MLNGIEGRPQMVNTDYAKRLQQKWRGEPLETARAGKASSTYRGWRAPLEAAWSMLLLVPAHKQPKLHCAMVDLGGLVINYDVMAAAADLLLNQQTIWSG